MGTRLYVGNLSYGVTNESLEQLFAQFGPVKSAQVITDRDTGRSKGFGFVQAEDGTEYFFHQSACADVRFDELREGQALTFEKGQGPKGPRAENIRVA